MASTVPINFSYQLCFKFVFAISILLFGCKNIDQENDKNDKAVVDIKKHANDLLNSGEIKKSITYIDSAYNHLENISNLHNWEKHNFKQKAYLNHSADLQNAKLSLDSMYLNLEGLEEKYAFEYAETKFSDGALLIAKKNYNGGLKKYYEGESFASTRLSPCDISNFTGQIAIVKYKQKRYLEAIPYLKKTLAGLALCENKSVQTYLAYPQSNLNSIGLCFEKAGLLDSAVTYYKKGIALINNRKDEFKESETYALTALGVIYGNLGGTYSLLGDDILAESLLKESIKINHNPGFAVVDAHSAELKLTSLYIKNNRLDEAKLLLNKLSSEIKNWEQPYNATQQQLLLRFKELSWRLLDKSNNTSAAYTNYKLYSELKDSLNKEEKSINEKDLESVFKIAKNEYELELLNKSNKLTTIYMWGAIISSTFLIVILVLIIAYLKRYKKQNIALKKLNQKVNDKNIQLENALSALQKSHEENYRMMKIIYHDLRSPIGGMTMAIGLMLEDEHHTTEDREMLQMINTSGQDAIGLINDMLQINTDVELAKENIKLDELLQYCSAMLQYKAEEKGQIIQSISEPIDIEIDQEKIRRVLNNLLSNAIKFSPFQSKIILNGIKQGSNILISCEDFGIGVPEDQLETIFDMFTEAKRMGTMGEVTFGMGLAICRQIVNAHKGQIWCENKIEGGSIFKILLPLNIT